MGNIKSTYGARKLIHRVIIIDTSVLIKNFIEEENSNFVDELVGLHDSKQLTLLSTPLLQFEFLNALTNIFKDERKVESALKKFFKIAIGLVPSQYGYMEKGIKSACKNPLVSYYDSSYHSLAKDMDALFLTADKKYYNAVGKDENIALLSLIATNPSA